MRNDLVIMGAGGLAREVAWVSTRAATGAFNVVGFVDAEEAAEGQTMAGLPVFCGLRNVPLGCDAVAGMGSPDVRAKVACELAARGIVSQVVVDRDAVLSDTVDLGDGCIIFPGAMLTVNVVLESHVHVSLGVTIGHDVRIGSSTVVLPGANVSGGVTIGERCMIGAGAVILQNLSIGDGARVGAGAVVTHDVPAGETVVGIPARKHRSRGGL